MFEIGGTGYAVKLGDRIGPVFGYVDEIQNQQLIVVEKFRDYLGNISDEPENYRILSGHL